MNSPEHLRSTEANLEALSSAAAERAEQLKDKMERGAETSHESRPERLETARKDAKEVFSKEAGKERRGSKIDASPHAIGRVTKAEKQASFRKTMKQVQSEMSLPSRTFSKIIHTPFIEQSSEIIGSSLARPNAVLAGSASALFLVALVYYVARTFGYQLSGFETIGAFVIGWLIGLIYDYIKIMITGKK